MLHKFNRTWWCLAALFLTACSAVQVRPTDPRQYAKQRSADVLDGGGLSAATRESLRILGLSEEGCRSRPRSCVDPMQPGRGLDEERRLSALAELWLAEAERAPALETYLEAARASYAYLFFAPRTLGERALEDRQRQVRDFYNHATERVAMLLFEDGRRESTPAGSWTIHRGTIDVRLPVGRPLQDLVAASHLSFKGIRNLYRRDGFGAEFVAVAAPGEDETGYVAASVVLRFAGSSLAEVLATRDARFEAYDSASHESLFLQGSEVRLAASFTAPYALWLERSHFGRQAKGNMVRRSEDLLEPRVFLMQPYDPERATVVLIHGLASSPQAWIELGNELTGDEEIRRNYQVWQVFYRTSAPIAYNVEAIRLALERTLDRYDPERKARASRDLVLVGHSMGGVIARLLVLDPGDALWRALLGREPDDGQRRRLAVMAPYLDLKPMPEVGRAVFLASPHRGAPLAGSRLGRLASRLIRLPGSLMARTGEIADALEAEAPAGAVRVRAGADGVDFLSDRRPYLETTSKQPIASGIAYHSIIACRTPSPPACTDGLVPYTSAHLDGAASELLVRSGHSVQQAPEAILELRRILRLHLEERLARILRN
ncbi:MAG: alpha/beta fold hydrolase [Acidobacteriota bacterium]